MQLGFVGKMGSGPKLEAWKGEAGSAIGFAFQCDSSFFLSCLLRILPPVVSSTQIFAERSKQNASWPNWWFTLKWCLWPSVRLVKSICPPKGYWQWEGINLVKSISQNALFWEFSQQFQALVSPQLHGQTDNPPWHGVSDPPSGWLSPLIR